MSQPRTLGHLVRPLGQVLEVFTTEKDGEVVLQWFDVDQVGDATPQTGERLTLHLHELRDLVATLGDAMGSAEEAGLSLDPPPPPPLPSFGGPR